MKNLFANKFTLGIYGDGQLARMLALSAQSQGLTVLIFTLNKEDSPCLGVSELFLGASFHDQESFENFCACCENIVLENEFIPPSFLQTLESKKGRSFPNAESYLRVSNKLKQVQLVESLGIKVPCYKVLELSNEDAFLNISLPCMLKSLSGGYDGYGNFTFSKQDQLPEAKLFLSKWGRVLAQEFISFESELAVMIVSDGNQFHSFPVVETVQENNICHFALTPARIKVAIQEKIQEAAIKIIKAINGVGLFAVEFFLLGDEILFNEVAPRPHNSGHFSIEACDYSQFDALVKLIKEQKLSPPKLTTPAVGMLNLLGTHNGEANFQGDQKFTKHPQGFLHLYGKQHSRIGRKMGHFTLLGENQTQILSELKVLKERYQI